jgi:hypothetical protein
MRYKPASGAHIGASVVVALQCSRVKQPLNDHIQAKIRSCDMGVKPALQHYPSDKPKRNYTSFSTCQDLSGDWEPLYQKSLVF